MDPVAEVAAAVLRDLGAAAADWSYDGLAPVDVAGSGTERWACFSDETEIAAAERLWLADPVDRDDVLLTLADGLPDLVTESRSGWGRPVPPCDLHPQHPLTAERLDDDGPPWWHCPATGEPRRPIGGPDT